MAETTEEALSATALVDRFKLSMRVLAAILCTVLNRFEIGTRSIFVGRVNDAETNQSKPPLPHANCQFTTIKA